MTHQTIGLVLFSVLAVSGCVSDRERPEQNAAKPAAATSIAWRVEQAQFGDKAKYVFCIEPACPSRTGKTMGVAVEMGPKPAPAAIVVRPQEAVARVVVTFRFNDAHLTAEARRELLDALPLARQAARIVINGRTDSLGDKTKNDRIALARAETARAFLAQSMPDQTGKLVVEADGACCYVAPNETTEGRASNRRVEVVFEKKG